MRTVPLLEAYYEVLNADDRFVQALAELDAEVGERVRRGSYGGYWTEAYAPLQTFVSKWHLPEDRGWRDLYAALRDRKGPPKLSWSGSGEYVPDEQIITPYRPEPLVYDPTRADRKQIRDRARYEGSLVEQSIMQQAEVIEDSFKEMGFRPLPPAHLSAKLLRQGALRLYRRAVLGWTLKDIADNESQAASDSRGVVTEDAIGHTVSDWADKLKVRVTAEV
jgi:hypothetical protein